MPNIKPKYELRLIKKFQIPLRIFLMFSCFISILMTIGDYKGEIRDSSASFLLLSFITIFLVLLFLKNHIEIAFVPLVIDLIRRVLAISLRSINVSTLISIAVIIFELAFLGLIFLSLYQDIPNKLIQICAIAFCILVFASSFWINYNGSLNFIGLHAILTEPIQYFPIILVFILFVFSEKRNFSGINLLPVALILLLCVLSLFFTNILHTRSSVTAFVRCSSCNGSGMINEYLDECADCNGEGYIEFSPRYH